MFERFTDRARRVCVIAHAEALALYHYNIGTEHLLLGLTQSEGIAQIVLASLGISRESALAQIIELRGKGTENDRVRIPFSPRAKKVTEMGLREALQLGHNYIGTEHFLLGLIREGEGVGCQIIELHGVTLQAVRTRVIAVLSASQKGMSTEDIISDAQSGKLDALIDMAINFSTMTLNGRQSRVAEDSVAMLERAIALAAGRPLSLDHIRQSINP